MSASFKYLENTYLFEDESIVSSIGSDERGEFITLENTIFHPQGGGQPSDYGIVIKDEMIVSVIHAAYANEQINLYIKNNADVQLREGDKIQQRIDSKYRIQNAKCHSAGHIVQAAVESLPYGLKAQKGYHFPDGAYVEFEGPIPEDLAALVVEANTLLETVIAQGREIVTKYINPGELNGLTLSFAGNIPSDRLLRVAIITGFENAVPCGGTHLRNVRELEKLEITKAKSKKGKLKVSYTYT